MDEQHVYMWTAYTGAGVMIGGNFIKQNEIDNISIHMEQQAEHVFIGRKMT